MSEPHFAFSDHILKELAVSQKDFEASCLKRLEAFKEHHFQNLDCKLCTVTGGVAESILEYAPEIQADVIMMPTRGTWSPRPFLIGSVTTKVLHYARCAVWTTPHPKELEPFRPYRHIVCAMDYRALSRDLLVHASQVATLFKSRLSVMTAIPCPVASSVPCAERQSVRLLKSESIATLQHLLRELSLDAPLNVLEGTVGEAVRQAVGMEDGDLVIIGRGHLDEPFGHLRTHAYEIIWNSPCPVLSVEDYDWAQS
jgi:nucleotide-binding universal stress UspA family protein